MPENTVREQRLASQQASRFYIISPRQWREQHDSRRFMFIDSVIITEPMAVCLRFSPLTISLKIQTLYASQPMSLRLY